MTATPISVLRRGVESLTGGLQPTGQLHDPVFDCPTQYGGAYYAWCCRVLARHCPDEATSWAERSRRAVAAAVGHTTDPTAEAYASGFDANTLSVMSRLNHRDFTWPPILKTLLADEDPDPRLVDALTAADLESLFRTRPPSNWAAVWMSGEWLRMAAGWSPTTPEELDGWLDVFFECPDGVGFDPALGMYSERGLPNSYDLFTRVHLGDLLVNGYRGRNHDRLRSFLATGLGRSLALQLSDGSLASGYRSAGQTWVLGAQILLFQQSINLGLGTPDQRAEAAAAAWRAFDSLARWQRPDGPFSPVQNLLPPAMRVGYEAYTADGHYSPLALSFLASAIENGFGVQAARPGPADLDDRPASAYAEGQPTHRGVAHHGRMSVAVQARADGVYDATGAVDLTFGTGRLLHLVSSARSADHGDWIVPGLAAREGPGPGPVTAVASRRHGGPAELGRGASAAGLTFRSELAGLADRTDPLAGADYAFAVELGRDSVEVHEAVPGRPFHRTLLIPYPRDLGVGQLTTASPTPDGVLLRLGSEQLVVTVGGPISRVVDLPGRYASRRGLCGLVRIDLREPDDQLRWTVTSTT